MDYCECCRNVKSCIMSVYLTEALVYFCTSSHVSTHWIPVSPTCIQLYQLCAFLKTSPDTHTHTHFTVVNSSRHPNDFTVTVCVCEMGGLGVMLSALEFLINVSYYPLTFHPESVNMVVHQKKHKISK